MNHTFVIKPVVKTISVAAAVVALLAANPSYSHANTIGGKNPVIIHASDEQFTVKYIGTSDNNFVFHVQFENPANKRVSVLVKNEAGTILYSENFSGDHFSKNFALPAEDGDIRPTFVVREGKNEQERSFAVTKKITES